jgi:hypothetical protein
MKPVSILLTLAAVMTALFLSGCATLSDNYGTPPTSAAREAMLESIHNEAPGDYYIGRRYFKIDYKFWGYIRRPGQSWSTAKLVMLNEQKHLAPDREKNAIGTDNGYEYKLFGKFSGDTVYEPASNGFYPEFVLTGCELISTAPAGIFKTPVAALDPTRRVIADPY